MNLALKAIPVPLRDDGHGGLPIGLESVCTMTCVESRLDRA